MLLVRRNSELLTAGPIGTGGDQPAGSRRWTASWAKLATGSSMTAKAPGREARAGSR